MILDQVYEFLTNEIVVSVISFILTIWIIWKQNTINRRMKKMIKLTDQEIKLIESFRKLEEHKQLTIYDFIEEELTEEEKKTIEDQEYEVVKSAYDTVVESIDIYRKVKSALLTLRENKDKYQFKEEIERIIENEE